MIRILGVACLTALLGLGQAVRGEDCGSGTTCAKPACAKPACAALRVSSRGPLAQAIGDQRCCAQCAAQPCWCPDDYCPKPQPCVPCPNYCVCPDTYCPKPQPCVPCPNYCVYPDTYCPKPAPNLCIPLNREFQRCVPMR